MTLTIERRFTTPGEDPFDTARWTKRTAEIKNVQTGEIVFRQEDVEFPEFYSDTAVNIISQKYFWGDPAKGEREYSLKQLITRVVDKICKWGVDQGYFEAEPDEVLTFEAELTHILLHQLACFNSPVWFNLGIPNNGQQSSACFLLAVEDNMDSIMNLTHAMGRVFKGGSGTGLNLSPLRSKKEKLTGGGKPSGPLSFLKIYDTVGGVIKSGGKCRRAAMFFGLHVSHPDIREFIHCKSREEAKQWLLATAAEAVRNGTLPVSDSVREFVESVDDWTSMDGEAAKTVQYQNMNISVWLPDTFMEAVEKDGLWDLVGVNTGEVVKTVQAVELWDEICESAWACADPGVCFDDTIQHWHTTKNSGPITTPNPCQPAWAPLLTKGGIRTLGELRVGDEIWSGKQWTKMTHKMPTGKKRVFRYTTTAGTFVGTDTHRIFSNGERVEVGQAKSIDICPTKPAFLNQRPDVAAEATLDGLVMGDGTLKVSNDGHSKYILLCIGEKDQCYFSSEVADLISREPFDGYQHRVKSGIRPHELVKTYDRQIPKRYFYDHSHTAAAFLRGLYSANGSVVRDRITLKTASPQLREQVQTMLSSLGIRSYFTTNKSKDVEFENGTYTCRESYDVNITSGRTEFLKLIGFIHPEKQRKLEALCKEKGQGKPWKHSFEIRDVEDLGEQEVYDITVEAEEHSYWTGGLLVSNCVEYMSQDNTACNLASINLLKLYDACGCEFSEVFVEEYSHVIDVMVLAQDILIDNSDYPTKDIARETKRFRNIGLGYSNLGGLLMALGIPYDSDEGRNLAASLTSLLTARAYAASTHLAESSTTFPAYEENAECMLEVIGLHRQAAFRLESDSNTTLLQTAALEDWTDAQDRGEKHGFANSQVSVLAPTGTISLFMDCDTTGIEPELALVRHKTLAGGGHLKQVNRLVPRALKALGYTENDLAPLAAFLEEQGHIQNQIAAKDLPVFDTSFDNNGRSIHHMGHVKMLAAVIPFVSGSISKTINMPNDVTVEDVKETYLYAWKHGLKALAIFRDGCKVSQAVSTSQPTDTIAHPTPSRKKMPATRPTIGHKFSIGGQEGFIHAGMYKDGRLGEVFLTMYGGGSTVGGLLKTVGILMSWCAQHGIMNECLLQKLMRERFDPQGFTRNQGIRSAKSPVDYVAKWLLTEFFEDGGHEHSETLGVVRESTSTYNPTVSVSSGETCRVCGDIMEPHGTCWMCTTCGVTTGC